MKEKINSISIFTMNISLCNSIFYGVFSSYILYKTKTDSLLSIIIGFIISLIISKLIIVLFDKYPNLSYVKRNKHIFKKGYFTLTILIIILSLISYTLLNHRLSSFLSNQYLIETPDFFILFMVSFITYYISSKGVETIFRVSTLTLYISLFIFIFDFISLVPQIDIENILPFFVIDFKTIFITSILFSINFSLPLIYLYAINKNQIVDKKNFHICYYLSIAISFIIILLNILTTIGVSGINVALEFEYPIYTTLKRIKLFSFLDSMENVSIMLWILFIINTSSLILLFVHNNIKELLKIKKTKIIMIILVLLSFAFSLFINSVYIESFNYIMVPFIVQLIIFIIELLYIIKDRLTT